jgi:hypothetical protein
LPVLGEGINDFEPTMPAEGAWGKSYTNNSVYKYVGEEMRQKAVVAKFIQDHPDYYQCDWNDKSMVDFIELSKKPFTTETINWAFQEVKHLLNPKPGTKWPKGWGQKVGSRITEAFSTSLNNSTTDSVQPAELSPASYMPVNIDGTEYQIPVYGEGSTSTVQPVVQSKPEAIAPLQTGRRIKDDDD